ncbi:Titin isoform N2B [Phytophthora cinnamomi]|uniref:Titin isoform N2B n=1 Tax=Phytophthora cinnamomi TaxID=4785 RepID=UPI00355942C6|nr:Titin isoform N2B [Phytophthora cinnamomi]
MLCVALLLVFVAVRAQLFTPEDVPGPPEKVLVSPASDSAVRVQFFPPLHVKPEGVNGAPVLGYRVELARRVDEAQTFTVAADGPVLAGGYRVTFANARGSATTSCVAWNASAVELETALEQLPNVDSVGVARSPYSAAKSGFVYTVTFDGAYLVNGPQPNTLVGDATACQDVQPPNRALSFEGAHTTTGVPGFYPEVWEVVSTDSANAQAVGGGTFDLSVGFEGVWVAAAPAVTATVSAGSRTATTSASMLGRVNRGDRVRIAGEEFRVHATAPFTDTSLPLDSYHVHGASGAPIQVMDTALGNVQVASGSTSVVTSSDFTSRIAGGEQIRIGTRDIAVASVSTGSITLSSAWPDTSNLHVTAYVRKKATVSVSAEAAEMKRALSALPGIGSIDVSRVGPSLSNGYHWYVTFLSLDSTCPTSPCFRVDETTGTTNFVDVYGATCATCSVTASIVKDVTQVTTLSAIDGSYAGSAIVASQEVGGVVPEVQSISTTASADDISGSFPVSFQGAGGAVINFDDTAADVRTKLQDLSTVGRLNVTRADNANFGVTWTITFLSNMGDLPLLVVGNTQLLKGTGANVVVQEVVKGVDVPLETIIDGLVPGQDYYVRAFARNENGYGASTTDLQQRGRGALPLLTSVATSPGAPGITGMWPLSGSQMELRLSSPVAHGDPVSKYLFEYAVGDSFGTPATKKVSVFNSLEDDIAGTFRLQYGDDITSIMTVETTASALESALNSLSCLRPVSVTRALYVLAGGATNGVTSFDANANVLTTTVLTATQCTLLIKGAAIDVGGARFTVQTQPIVGDSSINVEPGHRVLSFNAALQPMAVLNLDDSGSAHGPYGYVWTISFDNDAGDVIDSEYPGLQLLSSLTSVETGSALTTGITAGQAAVLATHYGYFEINNDEHVCDTFTGEARSLKILDFYDYNVRFWGHYPTGEWPTLQFDSATFGTGASGCAAWAPTVPNQAVYGQVHTVKYEGVCSQGQHGIQTILADASSTIGGTFTLSYMGEVTSPLPFQTTGAGEMRDAIDSITAPGIVDVSVSQYGAYGKAWHVTFVEAQDEKQDAIFIQHSRLTGQSALISVYPTVTVFTDAKQNDISGSFRISFNGEITEPIGFTATHMKVTQELQKLTVVDSVVALGDPSAGDIGVYTLSLTADATGGSQTLSNVKLKVGGMTIDPTRFLAIGETLVVGTNLANTIQAITPVDITLTNPLPGTATIQNYDVSAGLITKHTKPLPGFVGISPLMQVVAVTNGLNTFQLPSDHGFIQSSVFFIAGTMFTVTGVSGASVTTDVPYPGDSVASGSPAVYLFDNKLQTTEDLRNLVVAGDDLWLPSVSADMTKYSVTAVTQRYVLVTGSITDAIVRTKAYQVSYGRRWNLVFRSYDGSLDTVDAIPGHDWRGTDARIGTRSPKAVSPNVINVGNPAATQTILLEVTNTGIATPYTLTFAGETVVDAGTTNPTNIPWTTIDNDLKTALESLDSVDGVSVASALSAGTVIHTISFWGTYPMKKLPLLVVTPDLSGNLMAYVRGNDAVAVTKQDNLILENSQAYTFRIFVENSKGFSDSVSIFQDQTPTSSIVPTPPTGVALGEFHGSTWLSINYWAPFYSGGADVTMYRIEWDSSPNFDSSSIDYGVASIQKKFEVQQVTTVYRSSVGAGGTFTLSWGGHTTSPLPFDCSAADMVKALAIISDTTNVAVDPVKVSRAQVSWGYAWKITFLHNPGDLAPLVANGRQLTGDFPRIQVIELVQGFNDVAIGDFTHEVQEIFTDGVQAVGGSFQLTFNGKTTGTILVGASALDMQAALQATTTAYSIKVTQTVRNAVINTAIWSVTFAYLRGEEMVGAGNIFTMIVTNPQLTGTSAVVRVANKVVGSDPFRFSLTGLRPGVKYYAHVMAYNEDGFGSATSPLASAVTCSQPSPPQSVTASVVDGSTLQVDWSASAGNGEFCSVDKYKIEWYRAEGTQEQQTITTSAGKGLPEIQRLVNFADSRTLSGYFRLSFGGEVTENLHWDAPAIGLNSVKERLERLSTVGTVAVSKQESTRVVSGFLVTATSTTVTASVAYSNLAVGDTIWIAGNQRSILTLPSATTFTIDTALEVTIPVPVFKSAFGYEWKITFLAGHVGPQDLIQVSPSDSWTGNNPGILVDSIQKGLQPISGTFRVAFASGGVSDTSPPLPQNISAADLQTALEDLITIGAVNVTRSANGYGYNWVVTFLSEFKNDISLLSVDGTELQGPGARILAARTFAGVQPLLYCEQNGVAGFPAEVDMPGKLRYVIQNLQTGQEYAIRVRAHNSEGYGYTASITPAFQIPRSTPSTPQSVELLVLSSNYLKLRWISPTNDGGTAILGYQIQWDTASTFPNVNTPNYDYQTVVSVTSTDTGPYFYNIFAPVVTTYYVRVLALNDQGDGPYAIPAPKYARPANRTPGRVEDAMATVLSSYAILVEWNASSTDKYYYGGDGGSPITQYMIEWDTSPAFDSPAEFGLVNGKTRSFIIGGDDAITGVRSDVLIAGSSYSIRITAFNAQGSGPPQPTVPSSVVVTNQPPSPPQNLTLSVISATSVKAGWTNPLFDGGSSLKSYQIEWDEQDDFSSGQSSSATIPIVREMQSVILQGDVVNEEQFVDVTVEVVNEEQEVRSTFTGVDEIQVITTTNDAVVDEVQQVVTTANDGNEIQEICLDDDDIDEVQAVRTTVTEGFEVQDIQVGVQRVNEVQSVTLAFPGGVGNMGSISGTFYLTFDSTVCTYCLSTTKHSVDTGDLLSSLQESDNVTAAGTIATGLAGLDNIDSVTVSRSSAISGADLTYIYLITFSGNYVGGDVPLLSAGGTITFNSSTITPAIQQEIQGNEPDFDVNQPPAYSLISVTYTCESYSDPNMASSYSTACTPINEVCDACVTDFDGSTFTVTGDVSTLITQGMNLIAGVCSFEADSITFTTTSAIGITADDPGALCSTFTGAAFPLYMAPQRVASSIPIKLAAAVAADGGDIQGYLAPVIDSVTVQRNFAVTSDFVGAVYSVTFTKRSGKIPMLECDSSSISPLQLGTAAICLVTRSTIGSTLTGTFKIGLLSQDDTDVNNPDAAYTDAQAVYSGDIPWDASESVMQAALEAVDQQVGKVVFGTVNIQRSVYSPTGNKWSGGFSWQITFTSRPWDIPTIKVDDTGLKSSNDTLYTAQMTVGDAANPLLNPAVSCNNGNQIGGTMDITFEGITATCTLGVDTSMVTLNQTVEDANFENFFINDLKIPTITIMRSPASQALGFNWTITFIDPSTGGDVPSLVLATQLTSTAGSNDGRTSVIEVLKGNELAGAFQLVFNGETTGPIIAEADASAMQAQLNSLRSIKPSSVIVSRGPPTSDQVMGYTWFITFHSSVWADPTIDHSAGIDGNWKGAAAAWDAVWETGYSKAWGRQVGHPSLIQCDKSSLITTTNDGSQGCNTSVVTPGVGPLAGTFAVSLDSRLSTHLAVQSLETSDPIANNAWATKEESGNSGSSVEEILERMANVGDVDVSRSLVNDTNGGYEWTVTFLRDASDPTHPCEQLETLADGTQLCNSPGNVPQMTTVVTQLNGSNPNATVSTTQTGAILRGDFTDFKVQGDTGVAQQYTVSVNCANTPGSNVPCTVTTFTINSGTSTIQTSLLANDSFIVGAFTSCMFKVVDVTPPNINVQSLDCAALNSGNTAAPVGLSILIPWNADGSLVERVLEAAATDSGRIVSVEKIVHGKYGEMSWLVHFISNPSYTPLGAGNLPLIAASFLSETPLNYNPIGVTEVTRGSDGLSGSFFLDFHSSFGPREMAFNEDSERLERKLNEMDTIGRVAVERYEYPSVDTGCTDSLCSGGWDDQPVENPGTRGGYRWRIRFLRVTGEYEGVTFPPGSGNLDEFTVDYLTSLNGSGRTVEVYTETAGSLPILGTFMLGTATAQTPSLLYSSTAATVEQGIEAMDLFGEVDVTQGYLLTQKIPGVTASIARDSVSATITGVDDIRQFISPTDVIRFGSTSPDNLVGSDGDTPFTTVTTTSSVTVGDLSPVVVASTPASTKLLYPGMTLRIDGLAYEVQRSGHEIQTITVVIPTSSWNSKQGIDFYALTFSRAGVIYGPTACFPANEAASDLQAALLTLMNANAGDVLVSRAGPVTTATTTGYVYTVYYFGDALSGDVATLQITPITTGGIFCTGVTASSAAVGVVTQGGNLPHQRLSLATDSGQVIDTTGYYKISLNGKETDCLLWGAAASDVENALETKLSTGEVIVTRRGGGISQTEVQRLRMTADAEVTSDTTGLFQLQFTLQGQTAATNCISYGVSADNLEKELNGLSNLNFAADHINVTRDGDGSSTWGFGYEYLINFRGPVAGGYSPVLGNVPLLEIVNVAQTPCSSTAIGGHPALIMETVRQGSPGYTYDIFFMNYTAAATIPQLYLQHEGQGPACTTGWIQNGGSVRLASVEMIDFGGSSEIQVLTVYNKNAAGRFQLTLLGQTTACLPFSADASAVQGALNALSTIGSGGVAVSTDTDVKVGVDAYIHRVTFVGDLVTGSVPLLAVQEATSTCLNPGPTVKASVALDTQGGTNSGEFALTSYYNGEAPGVPHTAYSISQQFSVMSEQFEVQQLIVMNPTNAAASYTLTLVNQATGTIPWDASESALEAALTVPGVTAGDITVTRRTDANLAPQGYVYTVYFSGASVAGNLQPLATGTLINLVANNILVSTIQDGATGVPSFTSNSIPLALPDNPDAGSSYLSNATTLDVFKVNGFLWTIKFQSSLGNIPKLTQQTNALTGGTLTVIDDFIPGSASNSYVISNLLAGINYYVHVAAMTDIGTGPFTASGSIIPSGTASAVQNIAAGYALFQHEVQEVRLAATHITEIQEITTDAASIAEVQTLQTYASPTQCPSGSCIRGSFAFRVPTVQTVTISAQAAITTGTFTLLFTRQIADPANAGSFKWIGAKTAAILWNADASDVEAALAAVTNSAVTASDIVVTRDGDASEDFGYGYVFQITFVGNNVAGETSQITCGDVGFTTTGNASYSCVVDMATDIAMGTDTAVQQVIVNASKPLVAGSYSLRFNHLGASKTSGCISFDASASIMDAALEGMDNIDKVFVTRTRDASIALNGFVYQIFFHGNGVYGDVNLLEFVACNTTFQTLERNALTDVGVNGQVSISMVDYGGFNAANTFVDAATATAAELTTDLDRLPVFGDVLVSQSLVDEQGGYLWTVAFNDSEGDLPQFICAVDATFTAAIGTGCETGTLTDGNVLSGSFLIEASAPIPFNADAGTMKAALEAMSWVGTVQVKQSAPSPQLGYTWTITFLDYRGDVPTLLVTSSLVGTGSQISVQEVRKGNALGGNFTLAYYSSVTDPIDFGALAMAATASPDGSSMQEKLEALDVVGQVSVQRSDPDKEGGYSWVVTFLDDVLNLGDLPLLQGDASNLTGVGAVVFTKEMTKGSNAVGDQLWLSFDPPATDNGSPITKYQVRWDTSAQFTANPADVFITDADILYRTQRITTGAPSLAWSNNMIQSPVSEIQKLTILAVGTFTLKFRGVATATLTAGATAQTVGATSLANLVAALEALSSVGSVVISSAATALAVNAEFLITFTTEPGDLPPLQPSDATVASVVEVQAGTTNFRKEVMVFSCQATTGQVQFTYNGTSASPNYNALLTDVETSLLTLFGAEAESLSVSSASSVPAQTVLCSTANPADITISFDRVYGDISMTVVATDPNAVITPNTDASINGVYNDNPALTMSGTFQVGYQGQYTRPLNAESSADQLRYALEDLDTIQTVGVAQEQSYQPLEGKVDVTEGGIFVTCSAGETCNFYAAAGRLEEPEFAAATLLRLGPYSPVLNPIENVFSGFKSAVKDFMTERRAEILAVPPGTTMKAHRQRFLIEAVETLFPRVATAQLCASCYRHTLRFHVKVAALEDMPAVAKRKSPKKKKKKKKKKKRKKLRAPDSADESLSKPQGKDTGRQYTAAEMRHVLVRTGLFRPLERDLILSFIKPKLMSEFTGPFLAPDFDSLTSVMRAAPTLFEMLRESGSVLGAFEMKKVCHWDAEAWTCMIRDVLDPLAVLAGSVERDEAPSVADTTQMSATTPSPPPRYQSSVDSDSSLKSPKRMPLNVVGLT